MLLAFVLLGQSLEAKARLSASGEPAPASQTLRGTARRALLRGQSRAVGFSVNSRPVGLLGLYAADAGCQQR